MAVESITEQQASRVAARATVGAFAVGAKAVRPEISQRAVEGAWSFFLALGYGGGERCLSETV